MEARSKLVDESKSKEIILTGFDKQYFLYAKGHYVKKDVDLQGLKKIVCHVTGIEYKHATLGNIYLTVHGTWSRWVPDHVKDRFVLDMFHSYGLKRKKHLNRLEVIVRMLSCISLLRVMWDDKIIEMGKPDIVALMKEPKTV